MDDTAINSADAQEVTAMKSTIRSATAPLFPKSAVAAEEDASPEVTCDCDKGFGYVGKEGWSVKATAVNPSVVANPKGMANHASPGRRQPTQE